MTTSKKTIEAIPPNEAEAFAEWINDQGACQDALKWQHGKTLRETWDTCDRGNWLEWLLESCNYQWSAPALAEFQRVKATAWAEFQRVKATAWAEYERVEAPALAEYERVEATALAEFQRVKAPALAEYERVKAATIRAIIPYPFE